jgi:hypothetical protein
MAQFGRAILDGEVWVEGFDVRLGFSLSCPAVKRRPSQTLKKETTITPENESAGARQQATG